ncbi:acyltransferase [Gemmiger formicilis]|nr:acyltransferase [Gemmiger formicilis]
MALFFMLSGWLFSLGGGPVHFIKRKAVTLWLPFVLANTAFTVLNNLFLKLNVLTSDERILQVPGNAVTTPVTVKDVIGRTVHWCVFDGGTQLGGAMWFIQALFQVSILYALVEFILQRLLHGTDTLLPQGLFPACCCGWAGAAGWPDGTCGAGHCGQLLLPVLLGHGPAAHDAGKHTGVPARYFCRSGLCGAADSGAARLCGAGGQWIQQPDFPAGCQPGRLGAGAGGRVPDRSPALCPGGAGLSGPCDDADCDFALLSFKLVTWLGLLATGGEPYLLAAFPIYFTGGAWWLAYTAAGLVLPLAANAVYKKIKIAS